VHLQNRSSALFSITGQLEVDDDDVYGSFCETWRRAGNEQNRQTDATSTNRGEHNRHRAK